MSDDAALTEVGSADDLSSGEFYYDVDAAELYVDIGEDPEPKDIVASYELYFGTFDAHFGRDPLDANSRTVYYEPLIVRSPVIRQDVNEALFGYMPSGSASIVLGNVTGFLTEHLYASSFKDAKLALYHYLGELSVANVKLVYNGLIDSLEYSDDNVLFRVLDRTNIFAQEYRHTSDRNFFDDASFPGVDPNQRNRPIRKVFGVVDGVIAVNVDYSKTTDVTTNRTWVVHSGTSNYGSLTKTIAASSTDTRTYLDDADGIRVGDEVFLSALDGPGINTYVEVTAVSRSPAYIEHESTGSVGPGLEGASAYRSFIGNVFVVHDGIVTRLPGSAWSEVVDTTNGVLGVEIEQGVSAGLFGRYVGSMDQVYCRVYGEKCTATLGGSSFGSDSIETGTLTQGIVHLWNILRETVGLAESEIDTDAFVDLQASVPDELGFMIPFHIGQDFPSLRDVVMGIAQSLLLRVFLNGDGKWSIAQAGPLGSAAKTIADDELLAKRLSYSFDYADIVSDLFVEYAPSEVNSRGVQASETAYQYVHAVSDVARRLHKVRKQKTFKSWHFIEAEAQKLADRLSFYFGDRRGRFTVAARHRFFDSDINDVIEVSRARLPGFALDESAERMRRFVLVASSKTLNEIELTLDDQKGIEDNAGDW